MGEPGARHTRIRTDTDNVVAIGFYHLDLVKKRVLAHNELTDLRNDSLSTGGKLYAVISPLKNRYAKLVLERVHHMGKTGLRIAKLLRRGRKASHIDRGKQCFVF